MSFYSLENKLRRSLSTGALNTHFVNTKCVKCFDNGCHDYSTFEKELLDSFNKSQKEEISVLKKHFQKIKGMIQEQQCLLQSLKEDTILSPSVRKIITDLFEDSMKTLEEIGVISDDINCLERTSPNTQAKSLLAAIELKPIKTFDIKMRDMATELPTFLENEVLENPNVNVERETAVFKNCLHEATPPSEPYKQNREINNNNDKFKNALEAFDELEEASALFFKSIHKPPPSPDIVWKYLNNTLELESRNLTNLKGNLNTGPLSDTTDSHYADDLNLPPSPLQPADPEVSIIDHLMQSAVINKKIEEGDFNRSFEEALSYCNLSLVMAACRAANPTAVFNPCNLSQSVLLSLVQQLATDMVHETQLKCRYLEDALINLDISHQVTRAHLPFVVGEVRKNLSKFVRSYPNHVSSRRIALIIMAADNLMK